jgi:acyl carrier protein
MVAPSTAALEAQVIAMIVAKFGRIEADLNASGLVDSLGAMELLVLLQDELQVRLVDVTVQDLSSVARIVTVVEAAMARR